jgi:ectoine hydroxylase-related dioxygenase (phytanoyl-CoA dioxygenase family)
VSSGLRTDFERDGYVVVRSLFDPQRVAHLERDFDAITAELLASDENVNARWGGPRMERLDAAATRVLHTHNVQRYSAVWLDALRDPQFLDVVEQLIGPDIVLHHSKLFLKPAGDGSPFPVHQDWSYFPLQQDSMIAAVLHISEATEAMGCLRVLPGSHRRGRLDATSGQSESSSLDGLTLDDLVPIEAGPGDVLFFHYFTVHGSGPNRSDAARKTVLTQLFAGSDQEDGEVVHPNENLVLRGRRPGMTRGRAGR